MDKLSRAILITLPIDQKGTVARTYRRELAKLETQGRARRTGTEWVRTEIGNAYMSEERRSSAPPPASGESGAHRIDIPRAGAVPRESAPPREPSGQVWFKAPQSVIDALDARAKTNGTTRSEEVRAALEASLSVPARKVV